MERFDYQVGPERRDHHEAQRALLEELAPHWPEDWWFTGYLGWAQIETGAVNAGTRLVERSLALNPRNAHGAHQRAHGYFEADACDGWAVPATTGVAGRPSCRPRAATERTIRTSSAASCRG